MLRHAIWILILVVAALVGAGCAGGQNHPYRGETPFTGAYAGGWSVAGGSDIGYMTLTIADDATMFGTFNNAVTGETGRVVGATHPDGKFNASMIVDGVGTTIAITGIMALDEIGVRQRLAGDGVFTRPGGPAQGITFDLNQTAGTNPLAGSFGADWSTFATAELGVMNVTIAGSGLTTGQFSNTATGETGIIRGVVDRDGNFEMIWTVDGSGTTINVEGTMIRVTEPDLKWQGTGTWTREGQSTQGFQFTTPDPEEEGGGA